LVTLKDAADLIAQEFSTVMAWGALETAIERLMLAATTGTRRHQGRYPINSNSN